MHTAKFQSILVKSYAFIYIYINMFDAWFGTRFPANIPDMIYIQSRSAQTHWSVWPKPDTVSQNQTGSRLVLHNMIRAICAKTEPSLKVGNWLRSARNRARWFLHTGLLPDQMRLAKTWPGHPDRIRVGFVHYDPSLLYKNGTESICRKSDPAYTIHGTFHPPIHSVCHLFLHVSVLMYHLLSLLLG